MIEKSERPRPAGQEEYPQEALRVVFTETNAHLRNAEQKQLTVTSSFLTLLAVVVSLIIGDKVSLFEPGFKSAGTATFLLIFGSGVLVYQRWCRVWKVHYLHVLREIVLTWNLPDTLLPAWLRKERKPPVRGNVDNALFYLTAALDILLLAIICRDAIIRFGPLRGSLSTVCLGAAYLAFLLWLQHLKPEVA